MRALSDCIKEIRNDHSIATWNEAQAREWIILPILDLLGWGRREIIPEYKVVPGKIDSDKVDYALQINGDDKVFIEAKRPQENLENHQEQLLGYSFKKGIKLAILTNGIEWWFYLPLKEGDWDDRKFYTFDILEQEIEDIIDKFGRFLSRENVVSGEAVQQAESILKNRQKEKAIRESLPEAWNSVIKEPHELLVEILIETVEEVCDFKPENSEVLRFIRSKQENWLLSSESEQKVPTTNRPNTKTSCQTKNQTEKSKWMQIDGDNYDLRYKYEILVNTANWLIDKGDLKPSDCPIKKVQGKSDLINKTGNNLEDARKLKNGLYIDTHGIIKKTVIPYAKRLLKKYGYDPEILQIDY
ncbi:MAG: type I restriction enzyme HsdR N-terminal domain-containing protein [Gemmatimonadetes bacterium]|nr:type I restriction enzyme HsdR N-terminal domain-containing protein [Gemmatimonadota bacterium]